MKINGNAVRPGMVIEHQGRLWRAVRIQHTQPGKGGAYLQVELKDIRDGTKLNERFRSSETVEHARLDQKDYQYLYEDSGIYTFMDNETFEQVGITAALLEGYTNFLMENESYKILYFEGSPLSLDLPSSVVLKVIDAEPAIKGDTVSNMTKGATVETGLQVKVPLFIKVGDKIKIDTRTKDYLERVNT